LSKRLFYSNLAAKTNIMLRCKSTKNINELEKTFTHRWLEVDLMQETIKLFKISRLLKSFTLLKQKGFGFETVLTMLIMRVFYGEDSVNSFVKYKVSLIK
jgi:hypothetical protein